MKKNSPTMKQLNQQKETLLNTNLRKLFTDDAQRFANFSVNAPHWLLDYSRNLIDEKCMRLLIQLATETNLKKSIESMFGGEKINATENRAVLHTQLRDPKPRMICITETLEKMKDFCESIHNQTYCTIAGTKFTDVVNIGIGGSNLGPEFITNALSNYKTSDLRYHFASNIDPAELKLKLKKIEPESTLFIISSKSFTTTETLKKAQLAKTLITSFLGTEKCMRHFVAVTSNPEKAIEFGIDEENIFPMWDWVGGRFSAFSAVGLPIALSIGFDNFKQLLDGAHDMDQHFRHAPFSENLPVILALLGIWYRNFYGYNAHAIIPYSLYLEQLPDYLQQLEMESNGKCITKNGESVDFNTAPIIWGGVGTNSQHSFHQLLHQGMTSSSIDFIAFKHSLNKVDELNEMLFANCIAQAQALAFGLTIDEADNNPHRVMPGNKPSSLLLSEKLTPQSLGALIAAYEHKVFVQGALWDINSFDQYGVELGKKLAADYLQDIETQKLSDVGAINWFNKKEVTTMKLEQYDSLYQQSIDDPETFWQHQANNFLSFDSPWKTVVSGSFIDGNVRWFDGGTLNACYNTLDRHLDKFGDRIAYIVEANSPKQSTQYTYKQLHSQVCKLANVLKSRNINKGDRVCIYMPMIIEAIVAMLACARIGAVHSVVFGGFSPQALCDRIVDAECKLVITADEGRRGDKMIPLKNNVDAALKNKTPVHTVIVVKNTGIKLDSNEVDLDYHDAINTADTECPCEIMDAEDPLFILYTSGSTGKPKGVVHTTAGYLLYAACTFKNVFDYQDDDIFWCCADIGWITGHSYIVYAPLLNTASSVIYEGVPTYPNASRVWEIIDEHKVSIFYCAPTLIRTLMREGDNFLNSSQRNSLRLLGSVGEPINPAAWQWYYEKAGNSRCPIVDTWWQTETGGIMITPSPQQQIFKPSAATRPFLGIQINIVDDNNQLLANNAEGRLVIKQPWPGMMRTIYGDHQRYIDAYFKQTPGYYFTGDSVQLDEDGDIWITGRVDDVINVSGHRIGTAEIESALVAHPKIAEAAVIAIPHEIKGEALYAFVTPTTSAEITDSLFNELMQAIKKDIGSFAKPEYIQIAHALPKTRSGKIMRRLLRKIAQGDINDLGDTSTLAEPQVIDDLIKNRN